MQKLPKGNKTMQMYGSEDASLGTMRRMRVKTKRRPEVEEMKYQKGDIALTVNPMALGKTINAFQRIWSRDHKSKHTHALIIVGENGTTFESKVRIEHGHMDDYKGKEVVIFRNKYMNEDRFQDGFRAIRKFEGNLYPFHRLFYFTMPIIARYVHISKRPVCSELVCKFLYESGLKLFKYIYGLTPDNLDDEMRNRKDYDIIFEGKL